jgi:hypothetical protein
MLHACVERFDVMGERENILGWDGEVNKALVRDEKENDNLRFPEIVFEFFPIFMPKRK